MDANDLQDATLSRRFMAEPWRCPFCSMDEIVVRHLLLPGGPPGDVRREMTVTYDCRCLYCHTEWRAVFFASHIEDWKAESRGAPATS